MLAAVVEPDEIVTPPVPALINVVEVEFLEPRVTVFAPIPVPKFRVWVAEPVPMLTVPATVLLAILTGVATAAVAIFTPPVEPAASVTIEPVIVFSPIMIVFAPVPPVPTLIVLAPVERDPAILIVPVPVPLPIPTPPVEVLLILIGEPPLLVIEIEYAVNIVIPAVPAFNVTPPPPTNGEVEPIVTILPVAVPILILWFVAVAPVPILTGVETVEVAMFTPPVVPPSIVVIDPATVLLPILTVFAFDPPVAMLTARVPVAAEPTMLTVPAPVSLNRLRLPVNVFVTLILPLTASVVSVIPPTPPLNERRDVLFILPIVIERLPEEPMFIEPVAIALPIEIVESDESIDTGPDPDMTVLPLVTVKLPKIETSFAYNVPLV
jgi:hypothetical protein